MADLYLKSPIGYLHIKEDDFGISALDFVPDELPVDGKLTPDTELLRKAEEELGEYFDGKRKNFDLPLSLKGTPFQKKVWETLLQIPYGEMRTYGQVAQMVGKEKAFRAVGMANHANPVPILVPCHRVLGTGGKLTGYGGGLDKKITLLELEGIPWKA